jgi:hypothetical protein
VNERPVSGRGKGGANVVYWVIETAVQPVGRSPNAGHLRRRRRILKVDLAAQRATTQQNAQFVAH